MMGEISFKARNHCYFRGCLIKIVFMFYCCVEFLNLPKPPLLVLCLNLGIEALNENIGHWETTWFNFRILHLTILIMWGTTSITKQAKHTSDFGILAWHCSWAARKNTVPDRQAPLMPLSCKYRLVGQHSPLGALRHNGLHENVTIA